jgi:exopolysaccharide biosynthesis polyprenyl glycosylphosphotransferase
MNAAWVGLCGSALLFVWLLRDALTDMCKEEVRTRLAKLPYAILRIVALRIPRPERRDVLDEWRAELDFILGKTDGLPITRLLRGTWYSVGMLELWLPFDNARHVIAAYWWKTTRRFRRASWVRTYVRTTAAADGLSALAAGLLAFRVSAENHGHASVAYLTITLTLPAFWILLLSLAGEYNDRFIGNATTTSRRILAVGLGLTGSVALIAWVTQIGVSRAYVLTVLPAATGLDLLVRFALRKRLRKLRALGQCMSTVVAVGHEAAVSQFVSELRREPQHGLKVVAVCLAGASTAGEVAGVPVVGAVDDAARVVRNLNADTVAVLPCPEMDGAKLRTLARELEKTGTGLVVAPALLGDAGPRTTVKPTVGLSLLHVDHPELSGPRQVIKDVFDRVTAALVLVTLSPLLAAFALAIKLSDPGPALFTQSRVGKYGRPFKMYKFRTMVVEAEKRLAELQAHNEFDGALFRMRNDPRITGVGAKLRKWSLDELPQLINVVRGEMSLVGPRPALPNEAVRYADHVRRRLVVKPGLTGMWQVNGRSDLSWEEAVRLDLRYVENWSFALDLQILWKTVSVLFRGAGAY